MPLGIIENRLIYCELQAAAAKRFEHQGVILDDFTGSQTFMPSSFTLASVKLTHV